MLIAGEAEAAMADEVTRGVAGSVVATLRHVLPHVPAEIAAEAREMAARYSVDGLVTVGAGRRLAPRRSSRSPPGSP
jgi:methyl coenzyme M reductase subunit C-like uncharacterized protein (methanogenesis marker protein 7)